MPMEFLNRRLKFDSRPLTFQSYIFFNLFTASTVFSRVLLKSASASTSRICFVLSWDGIVLYSLGWSWIHESSFFNDQTARFTDKCQHTWPPLGWIWKLAYHLHFQACLIDNYLYLSAVLLSSWLPILHSTKYFRI